jgi:hypothetical protein
MPDTEPDEQELKLRVGDKTYPFPSFDTLSYREATRIKKETGLVMGQFFVALESGDPDALLAVALIAKLRDYPKFNVDELYDLQLSDIEIIVPESEPEERDDSPLDGSGNESETSSDDKTNDEPTSPDETPSPS